MKKSYFLLFLPFLMACSHSFAVEFCDINGKEARSAEDLRTKSGILKCRDSVTNALIYEKEVKNGILMGSVKEYRLGVLAKDYSVNENSAYDGLYKEYTMSNGAPVLLKELIYKNGAATGISKSFYPAGGLKRISYNAGGNREESFAEFTTSGRLAELLCTNRPVFAPALDDLLWCGHKGSPVSIYFYGEDGSPKSKNVFQNGDRLRRTTLWNNGQPQSDEVGTPKGGIDTLYYESGIKKKETQWVYQGVNRSRVPVIEIQYGTNGKPAFERKWKPVERGTQPVSFSSWYPSGEPKMKSDFVLRGAPPELVRREVLFHENGKVAGQGLWGTNGQQDTTPRGVQSTFNEQGILTMENTYNDRGEVIRERDFDDQGNPVRDNEITPDGQRMSLMKGGNNTLPKGLVPLTR